MVLVVSSIIHSLLSPASPDLEWTIPCALILNSASAFLAADLMLLLFRETDVIYSFYFKVLDGTFHRE